jgi:hypothetical protein
VWLAAGTCLFLLVYCPRLPAGDAPEQVGSATRLVLEKALRQVEAQMARKAEAMRSSYLTTLKALRPKLQAVGDLDGILALDAEAKRVQAKDWLTTTPPEETPKSLQDLPARCVKALAAIDAERNAARIKAHEQYIAAVDQQVRDLVRGGKLDPAKLLHAEMASAKEKLEELKRQSAPAPADPQATAPSTSETPAVMEPFARDAEPAPLPVVDAASAKPPLIKLDFDGKDLTRYRKEGTGAFAERGGKLVIDNYGNNHHRQPYYGMRLRVPVIHRGDFNLKALATLRGEGNMPGLIRLTAHFANNSEAVCEVSGGSYDSSLVSRFTGQPDNAQSVYLTEMEQPRFFSSAVRKYISPNDMPLTIERKGNEIIMKVAQHELGRGNLTTSATYLCGFSIDIQRSRDKGRQPAEMWVDSLELTP